MYYCIMKTLEQYGGGHSHLSVPCGLAVDNDIEFVLGSPIEKHNADITIHVVPESILDSMYETVMVGRGQKRHTRKKRS